MAEVGLAAFSSIVSEGARTLFKPIIRQVSYLFKYQSYIDELKNQVRQLGYKREMVQQPVNQASVQGDEIYEGVTNWLNSVDEFSEGVAKSIIDDEDRAKKSCFKGLCPNLISRYKLSKQAATAAEAAANLVGEGNFSNVSFRPTPRSTEVLSKDEALQLFEYTVGDSAKTSAIQPIADEIVERCEGLPVALSTIANALKSKSLDFWKDALYRLRSSNAREIHGMRANVFTSIELSYNLLEIEEAKSLCSFFVVSIVKVMLYKFLPY